MTATSSPVAATCATSARTRPPPLTGGSSTTTITKEVNARYGLNLTDAFCGFKAYRRAALDQLHITETGWGMPLQLWVQAARQGLRVKEIGVPRLYLDPKRAFGGVMNDPTERLAYYRAVLASAEHDELPHLPTATACVCPELRVMARLRAPTRNGEVLAEPGFGAIPAAGGRQPSETRSHAISVLTA